MMEVEISGPMGAPIEIEVENIFEDFQHLFNKSARIFVGFSGGMDSTVLLHLTCKYLTPSLVTALHVNHGISSEADLWEHHAEQQGLELSVNFEAYRVSCLAHSNREARAREGPQNTPSDNQQLTSGPRPKLTHSTTAPIFKSPPRNILLNYWDFFQREGRDPN